jgi:hypothetical protein
VRSLKGLVAVSVLGLVVGSVGSAFAAPLSETQWKKKANAICRQINNDISDAGNEIFAELGPQEEPTDAQLREFVDQIGPVVEAGLVSINKLEEPKSLKKGVRKFSREAFELLIALDEDPTILLTTEDPFADANKAAKAVGLKACAG